MPSSRYFDVFSVWDRADLDTVGKREFASGISGPYVWNEPRLYFPSLSSIAADRFHPMHTGQGLSLYMSASSLGLFIGPPVWGLIADQPGYASVFTAAGLLLALGTTVFIALLWRSARR